MWWRVSAKKRARKNSTTPLPMTAPLPQTLKEEAQADLAAIYEQVMLRVKSLPRMPLTEPEVAVNFSGLCHGQCLPQASQRQSLLKV